MRKRKKDGEALTKQVSVRMTEQMAAQLAEEADRQGLAVSLVIKDAISEYLNHRNASEGQPPETESGEG